MMSNDSVVPVATVRYCEFKDVEQIRPNFTALSSQHQLQFLRRLTPDYHETVHNIASTDALNYFVDEIDPNNTGFTERTVDEIAVGTDDTEPTQSGANDGVNSPISNSPFSFTSTNDAGATYETTLVLDSSQANGNTLAEIALKDSGTFFWNRALIGPRDKTNDISVTIEANLGFEAV